MLRYPVVSFVTYFVFRLYIDLWASFVSNFYTHQERYFFIQVFGKEHVLPDGTEPESEILMSDQHAIEILKVRKYDHWYYRPNRDKARVYTVVFVNIFILFIVVVNFFMELPILLADIFLQNMFIKGIYRPVNPIDLSEWIRATYWKITKTFGIIVLLSFIAGFVVQRQCPGGFNKMSGLHTCRSENLENESDSPW